VAYLAHSVVFGSIKNHFAIVIALIRSFSHED